MIAEDPLLVREGAIVVLRRPGDIEVVAGVGDLPALLAAASRRRGGAVAYLHEEDLTPAALRALTAT